MDAANAREAVREALADVEEGADMVMVKPGLPYLDVIRAIRDRVEVPVAAYQVSGEFSMLHAAAERGWIDLPRAMHETAIALRRAGADVLITYFARELATALAAPRATVAVAEPIR
jgi:porphobilinogen synthase